MTAWTSLHPGDRGARHVRRTRLCLDPSASRVRLVSMLEESLRLAALPGEQQGRVYYFRYLRLTGLPANGDRTAWLQGFQRLLGEQAESAVDGAGPSAALAPAVYFASDGEACEILLRRLLERRRLQEEWFWPPVLASAGGSAAGDPAPGRAAIPAVIERLSRTPASWMAVAETVFAALAAADPLYLLQSIPVSAAEAWLREIGGWRPQPRHAPPITLSGRTLPAVVEALRVLGAADPRTQWLAALAVILSCPSDLTTGAAVARSQLVLSSLGGVHSADDSSTVPREWSAGPPEWISESRLERLELPPKSFGPVPAGDAEVNANNSWPTTAELSQPDVAAPMRQPDPAQRGAHAADAESIADAQPGAALAQHPASILDLSLPTTGLSQPEEGEEKAASTLRPHPADPESIADARISIPEALPQHRASGLDLGPSTANARISTPAALPHHRASTLDLGLPTAAGGLFFLLNALSRVGIAQAMEGGLAWAHPRFVARTLLRLAARAGVEEHDPVVTWLAGEAGGAQPDTVLVHFDPAWWPSNVPSPPHRDSCTEAYLVRAWHLAVRRWCWRMGRIPAAEIVRREAIWSVNRTDLDVTLPMDTADIRVRRAGLDLDPGWLPWFGRVVRFHYRYRGETHG